MRPVVRSVGQSGVGSRLLVLRIAAATLDFFSLNGKRDTSEFAAVCLAGQVPELDVRGVAHTFSLRTHIADVDD